MSNCLLAVGAGYTAQKIIEKLASDSGWSFYGTCRHKEKLRLLHEKGIRALYFDPPSVLLDNEEGLKHITHMLLSIPPTDTGDLVFQAHADFIAGLPDLRWIGYISTTGVYGDCQGNWVDENATISPSTKRAKRRALAEQQWLSMWQDKQLPVHIFRSAGIYGPGRSAIDNVLAGKAKLVHKEGHVFSRIHVEDLASIIIASMLKPSPGAIYNCADDAPASQEEVVAYACELLDVSPPPKTPYEEVEMSSMQKSFYVESRRVDNRKIKDELQVQLCYPDYKSGLKAIANNYGKQKKQN